MNNGNPFGTPEDEDLLAKLAPRQKRPAPRPISSVPTAEWRASFYDPRTASVEPRLIVDRVVRIFLIGGTLLFLVAVTLNVISLLGGIYG